MVQIGGLQIDVYYLFKNEVCPAPEARILCGSSSSSCPAIPRRSRGFYAVNYDDTAIHSFTSTPLVLVSHPFHTQL